MRAVRKKGRKSGVDQKIRDIISRRRGKEAAQERNEDPGQEAAEDDIDIQGMERLIEEARGIAVKEQSDQAEDQVGQEHAHDVHQRQSKAVSRVKRL